MRTSDEMEGDIKLLEKFVDYARNRQKQLKKGRKYEEGIPPTLL